MKKILLEELPSLTSTFQVKVYFDNGRLRGSLESPIIYSERSSLGWRLKFSCRMLYVKRSTYPYLDVSFDPLSVDHNLGPLMISAEIRPEDGDLKPVSHSDGFTRLGTTSTISLPSHTVEIGSWNITAPSLRIKCTVQYSDQSQPARSMDDGLQQSLENSVRSGAFVDTRFFAFSRRQSSGRVDRPVPIFANSSVLKGRSAYFQTLLSVDEFSESAVGCLDSEFPEDQLAYADDYDYDSDSDLEGSVELTESTEVDECVLADKQLQDACQMPASDDSTGSKKHEGLITETDTKGCIGGTKLAANASEKVGRTIIVRDMASMTFSALICYLYTDDVDFSPLKSQHPLHADREPGLPSSLSENSRRPSCSPKSMYRLADKLGLQELKNRAFDTILNSFSEENIVEEAFSKFTSTYSEILEMESAVLCRICKSASGKDVVDRLEHKMKSAVNSDIGRSATLVALLIRKLAEQAEPPSSLG